MRVHVYVYMHVYKYTFYEILLEQMKLLEPELPELIILPEYSTLPSEMQTRIFDPTPPGTRK